MLIGCCRAPRHVFSGCLGANELVRLYAPELQKHIIKTKVSPDKAQAYLVVMMILTHVYVKLKRNLYLSFSKEKIFHI